MKFICKSFANNNFYPIPLNYVTVGLYNTDPAKELSMLIAF